MVQANDSVLVTPGSGATIATHLANSKEHQAVVLARPDGHLYDADPIYRLLIPGSAVGANKVHADLFNATGSGKTMRVLSAFCFPDIDTAVTGTLGVEMALTRTTAVGTGGTAATADGTSISAATFIKMDTTNAALPAGITARAAPGGGATAGAWLGTRWVFTEETNAGSAISASQGAEFIRNEGASLIIRENEGLRFVQGAVASVGTLSFEITFETF